MKTILCVLMACALSCAAQTKAAKHRSEPPLTNRTEDERGNITWYFVSFPDGANFEAYFCGYVIAPGQTLDNPDSWVAASTRDTGGVRYFHTRSKAITYAVKWCGQSRSGD